SPGQRTARPWRTRCCKARRGRCSTPAPLSEPTEMAREPTLGQLRQKRARYETARATAGAKIDAAAQTMREIDEAMVAARNAGDLATEKRLGRQRETAAGKHRALHEGLGRLDREFELPDLGRFTDPCAVESDTPLILLPLRVETRYTADRQHLRV